MQSKHVAIVAVVVVVLVVGAIFLINKPEGETPAPAIENEEPSSVMPVPGTDTSEMIVTENESEALTGEVKEFTMDSYYAPSEGRPYFSLNEMTVNQGDTVRVKVTNTFGQHNFNIDEYNIKQLTPLNQETVIEFVADKSGEFVYYCSQPGHRAAGQWGTLKVLAQ